MLTRFVVLGFAFFGELKGKELGESGGLGSGSSIFLCDLGR